MSGRRWRPSDPRAGRVETFTVGEVVLYESRPVVAGPDVHGRWSGFASGMLDTNERSIYGC